MFALRRKYAELKGVLKYLPADDPEPTITALRHVGCTLRMFSPGEDLTAIVPRRPYKPQRHSWARTALDILRRTGRAMTARELARAVLAAEGVAVTPDVLMSAECSLHAVLGRLELQGLQRQPGSPKMWKVV